MDYIERQNEWIVKHGLCIGDKVKVTRKAEDFENGWGSFWVSEWKHDSMTDSIGKTLKIEYFVESGIRLDDEWEYPYFVLEPVKAQNQPPKPPKYQPYKTTMTLKEIREFFS